MLGKATTSLAIALLALQSACGLEAPESPKMKAKYIAPLPEGPSPSNPESNNNANSEAKPLAEIAEGDVLALIRKDLSKVSPAEQKRSRYFTLHIASNAGLAGSKLDLQRQAFLKILNSLSTKPSLAKPVAVDANKILYRVNLEDIGMSSGEFDQTIRDHYPFRRKLKDLGTPESIDNEDNDAAVRKLSGTDAYLIRMDWWNATAALPNLYAKFMRFPDNQSRFEEQVLDKPVRLESLSDRARRNVGESVIKTEGETRYVDARIVNILNDDVLRTGFDNSNVSFSNRIVERHEGRTGGYYLSYDFIPLTLGQPLGSGFASQEDLDRHNINKSPLGPAGTNSSNSSAEFKHDGGEVIYMLPNGLFGYYLINAAGARIDKGPKNVVHQEGGPSEFNQAITNGHSCMSCHNAGLLEKPDTILAGISLNKDELLKADISRVNRQYNAQEYQSRFADDNTLYRSALTALGINPDLPDPVDGAYRFYNRPLNRADVKAELGLSEQDFKALLLDSQFSGSLNALNNSGFISRPLFQSLYPGIIKKFKQEIGLIKPSAADFVVSPECMILDNFKMDQCVINPSR